MHKRKEYIMVSWQYYNSDVDGFVNVAVQVSFCLHPPMACGWKILLRFLTF